MTDVVSKKTRSRMMSGIKGKDTKPELEIRSALHKRGYRFRLHYSRLPGKPDLVLPKYRAVIQIHGCFWHAHDCHLFKWPSTRKEFWREKILGNQIRDAENVRKYDELGWKTLVIWECAIKGRTRRDLWNIIQSITSWLRFNDSNAEISGL